MSGQRRRFLGLLLAGFVAAVGAAAQGGTHALLVGVSDYDESVSALAPDLRGPANDVALMRQLALEAGVAPARIATLTDRPERLPEAARAAVRPPTRDAVLAALDALAVGVRSGDEVLLFFAGHGAKLPDEDGAAGGDVEPDGMDEVFLTADFRRGGHGAYPPGLQGALRDDEIGARIDSMLARGASVWLVADTCHAGTLRRSSAAGLVPRQMALGAPARGVDDDSAVLVPARGRAGQFVGFYAARSGSLAYEVETPGIAVGSGPAVHGILTWALAQAVRAGGAPDYAALARATGTAMWEQSGGAAGPDFAGALGEVPMLGAGAAPVRQVAVRAQDGALHLAAGRLDGLAPGASVALYLAADGARTAPLAVARIAVAGLDVARIAVPGVGEAGAARLDRTLAGEGLDPGRHRARWLADRAPALVARLQPADARPRVPLATGPGLRADPGLRSTAELALSAAVPAGRSGTQLDLTAGRLRMTIPGLDAPLAFPATPDGLGAVDDRLRRLRHAAHLRRVAGALAESPVSAAMRAAVTAAPSASPDCVAKVARVRAADRRVVHHCDRVEITVRNIGTDPLDVTPLYLAPDGEVFFLSGYAGAERGGLRLPPGESAAIRYREETAARDGRPAATGAVTLLLFAVPADGSQEAADFRDLQSVGRPMLRAVPDRTPVGVLSAGAVRVDVVTVPPDAPSADGAHATATAGGTHD